MESKNFRFVGDIFQIIPHSHTVFSFLSFLSLQFGPYEGLVIRNCLALFFVTF